MPDRTSGDRPTEVVDSIRARTLVIVGDAGIAALREAAALAPVLDAAEARWTAIGQPAADDVHRAITPMEADIERDDLAQHRQYLASLLDRPALGAARVEHDLPHPDTGHEGLCL